MTTVKQLEAVVSYLNERTGSPAASFVGGVWQVGNYHLGGDYGGFTLFRVTNEQGGVTDVLRCGCLPKRQIFTHLHAFLAGLEAR
jgi:hypothetical protein